VGGGPVSISALVYALRDMRRGDAAHRLHLPEQVVEHVAPVREHVQDHSAAILLPVVPGGALRGNDVALEHPVAELTPHGEDLAEEATVAQGLELHQAGEPELVLHHPMLHTGG